MAVNQSTVNKAENAHLRYPGWNLGWKKPGDQHDPIMDALIRRHVMIEADDMHNEAVGTYFYHQGSSPELQGVTLREFLDVKIGTGEMREAQEDHSIRQTNPDEAWSEWMGNPYTEIGHDGRIEWVSYVSGLTLFDGYGDFPVLEDADFTVNIEASTVIPGLPLKITIQSPVGQDILPPHQDMPSDGTWLYRMFDEEKNLLYIGISKDAFVRFSQHERSKPWIDDVSSWTREKFNTRRAALIAEKRAIKQERPLFNVVHNTGWSR